ncbi:hypothetical protein [Rossellomorea marisflavi]|nr:hypothetical protein [Rossellomorea marisflavi]
MEITGEEDVELVSISEQLDTRTAIGKAMFWNVWGSCPNWSET